MLWGRKSFVAGLLALGEIHRWMYHLANASLQGTLFSDCVVFTLRRHLERMVNGISALEEIPNASAGDCFFACFNKTGCYTFSYNANTQYCALYPYCDASINLSYDSNVDTYVRECASPTISGILFQANLLIVDPYLKCVGCITTLTIEFVKLTGFMWNVSAVGFDSPNECLHFT